MLAFDFPTPFSTKGSRDVTNVPAQSLALMNDKFIYEQSRVWAERILREMKTDPPPVRIQKMFEQAFARPPADHELSSSLESLTELMALHGNNPESRELWQDFCHVFFSMNDFIFVP